MSRSESTTELATQMVHSLPGWGSWASNVRDFKTPYGSIGFRQTSILWMLRYELIPVEERTPTGFARYYGIQNSAVTKAVDKLVDGGYLLREMSETDHRRYYLTPTQKGLDISVWIERLYAASLQDALAELDPDQQAALSAQLDVLQSILWRIRHVPINQVSQ